VTAGERLLAPLERLLGVRSIDEADHGATLEDHVVLVGFGVAGRLSAQALERSGVRCVVLELNAENVRAGRALGLPIFYGDATSEEALHHAHVEKARLVVLLMNDPAAARRVVDTLRRIAPEVPVLMRAHYHREREGLLALGAREVVAEEVEGAMEILTRLLRSVEIPRNQIERRIAEARRDTQSTERPLTVPRNRLGEVRALADLKIECVSVEPGSPLEGRSAVELELRTRTGALVVGVLRGGELLQAPDPRAPFVLGDVVYFVGTTEAVERTLALVAPGGSGGEPILSETVRFGGGIDE
jgi:CPA2 family monovalent cation:H+ antiporter-2